MSLAGVLIARTDVEAQSGGNVDHTWDLRDPGVRRLRRTPVHNADCFEHIRYFQTRGREPLGDRGRVATRPQGDGQVDLSWWHEQSVCTLDRPSVECGRN